MPSEDVACLKVGYVVKMYPRFSETFILNEILAVEAQGVAVEIFSLRGPVDGRFHENLARVTAQVCYLPTAGRVTQLWQTLRQAATVLPATLEQCLPELLAADPTDACQAIELACRVRERDIDHLHAHFGSVAATVARLAAHLAGVPYTFTAHAKDIFHDEVDHVEMQVKLTEAAAVVTVSDFNERWLKQVYGADVTITRIYNGLDLEAYDHACYEGRRQVVVGVGRLVEKKGFRHLLDAFALLRKDGVDVALELIGSGPEEQALRAQAAEHGLGEAVRFRGPQSQAATRELVRSSAVLAAPCVVGSDGNRDGLPTVLLEALAVGTPVVATPVTGIPEAVIDGQTGLLVPEADPAALAEGIGRLLADPGYATELAANGRRHMEGAFDVHVNTRDLVALFERAVFEHGTVV